MNSVSMGASQAAQWMSLRSAQAGAPDPSQKLFGKLDLNSDGGIDATELKSFVEAVAKKSGTQAADANAIMTSLDSDGDGSVSGTELSDNGKALFDQLRQQLMGAMQSPPQQPDIGQLFSALDTNGDGSIGADEFSVGMKQRPQDHAAADAANRSPPNDGFGRLIKAVLAEYGSSGVDSAGSVVQGGALDIAA